MSIRKVDILEREDDQQVLESNEQTDLPTTTPPTT